MPYESKATRCSARALMGGFALDLIIYDRIGTVLSRFFIRLLAALYAVDYIGAQFLHTSADGSVRGDEFGFVVG